MKNIMEDMDKEDYRKPSGDEGEVVFSQQEEGAASTGPHGPRIDRQNENGLLEDTEPYHGARPRMIDVNQLVDNVLGATMGTVGQDVDLRDTPAPMLPPEQQIRQQAEIQTPPRRDTRRDGSQRPKGPRLQRWQKFYRPRCGSSRSKPASDEWSLVWHWKTQCYACSVTWRTYRRRTVS